MPKVQKVSRAQERRNKKSKLYWKNMFTNKPDMMSPILENQEITKILENLEYFELMKNENDFVQY